MKTEITIDNRTFKIDLSAPLDISIPLRDSGGNPTVWGLDGPKFQPVRQGDWIGKVSKGAAVNFNDIRFNPHAHGTHTESYGHISDSFYPVNQALQQFFFTSALVTVAPEKKNGDLVITEGLLKKALENGIPGTQAVVIRTLPNGPDKKSRAYTGSNWPYLSEGAARYLRERQTEHLLIDIPSVDKEEDGGKLLAHRAFWNYPENPRKTATITEMVYIPDTIPDGPYVLNLQMAPFENDAAPSRPVLFSLK